MDAERLDRWARSLTIDRSRRRVLRGLAVAAFGGALGLPLVATTEAKRKQKEDEVCRKGRRIARLSVPANGDSVKTPVLARGQRYLFRVSSYIRDEDWGLDAEYYFRRDDPTNPAEIYDACFDGTDVGLSIDDALLDGDKSPRWGAYTAEHNYERKVIGEGERARLRLHDCRYEENTGSLTVEIFCA
jgi:hypothetical protein